VWLCLVCGAAGCGDTALGHIGLHHVHTGHAYAVNVDTRLVFDHAGAGYVHRLALHRGEPEGAHTLPSSKVTCMSL
jgi:hypothetical protein